MELKQIQELIKAVNKSNLSELTIEDGDFKITIKQLGEGLQIVAPAAPAQMMAAPAPQVAAAPAPVASPAAPAAAPASEEASNLIEIKSPMIGTFYRNPKPGEPAFVNVGDEISEGKVVCIIEAMKLFNEIESEVSGKIVKVLVDDATPVEYDQPLFLVEPA